MNIWGTWNERKSNKQYFISCWCQMTACWLELQWEEGHFLRSWFPQWLSWVLSMNHIQEREILLIPLPPICLNPRRRRKGDKHWNEGQCGGRRGRGTAQWQDESHCFSLSTFKLVSSCLSLDDPGNLVCGSCQLTSKVANRSQLLSSDAGTYNLSSFVVCRAETSAKPAGRVLNESGFHWNDARYSYISRKSNSSLSLLLFFSLQMVRDYVRDREGIEERDMWWRFFPRFNPHTKK